jgi:hypothetical protein
VSFFLSASLPSFSEVLQNSLSDKEESVRYAVILSLGEAGLADGELLTLELVHEIGLRCRDKKLPVRRAALETLADLFAAHCSRFWREGQGAPLQTYRSIPKRLLLAAKLDLHTSVTVDVLFDERILGSDVSVEQRTRCLTGVYVSLMGTTQKKAKKPVQQQQQGGDGMMLTVEEQAAALAKQEEAAAQLVAEESEARMAFEERILGTKVRLHSLVNGLLDLPSKLRSGALTPEAGESERVKLLHHLAREVNVESAGDVVLLEDLVAALTTLFFEAKDKAITKCLRALASPLTGYEQIRLAQQGLPQAVKQMGAGASASAGSSSKGKKGSTLVTLANRLATMLSLAILPMESIEVLFREMESSSAQQRREAYFLSLQGLLLLIAAKFPKLLTHPNTVSALLSHVRLGLERGREEIVVRALRTLVSLPDSSALLADRKLDAELLAQLKELALRGMPEHAELAVQVIQNLWSPTSGDSADGEEHAASSAAGSKKKGGRPSADSVLSELLQAHCSENLDVEALCVETALSCASKIALVNFGVFKSCSAERGQLLSFLWHTLLPHSNIVALVSMREAGLLLVQNFLLSFGRSGVPLDGPLSPDQTIGSEGGGSSSPSKSKSSDASSLPRNWLVALLKILKLDGRWPDLRPNVTTRQQLESVDPNESAEEQEARLHFLLHASYALLELCTVPVYKAFLTHPPALINPALEKAAPIAAAVSHAGGLLSPKVHAPVQTAAMASHPVRHVFHMLPIFFMARHDAPGVVKGFVERVMKVSTSLLLRGKHLWEKVVSLMRRGLCACSVLFLCSFCLRTACPSSCSAWCWCLRKIIRKRIGWPNWDSTWRQSTRLRMRKRATPSDGVGSD